ncbi:hypothetical protein [Dactylosporangium sp. CA-139066]|uniref:hypothetical protein n=1 Tax=Dactylosporangium sp. CA-139066 TaxID=3239930 RepID=UPI003D8AC0FC
MVLLVVLPAATGAEHFCASRLYLSGVDLIARHVRTWALGLIDGGPRRVPRRQTTLRAQLSALQPVLLDWSTRYEHLREITRDVVLEQIRTLHGQQRQSTLQAMRSLFRWAKTNGIVFRDPTSRIKLAKVVGPIPQPLTPEQIKPTLQAAHAPHARLAIALAAVHAARHADIRAMQLSDVDLGNRRLSIAGRIRPLDELTYAALTGWLNYRSRRWPNTANPHLLISKESALRLGPVTHPWINRILRGLPATLERLRVDRQLDEAITSGGDPLHLAAVFGIADTTAIRYANAARQLLTTGVEQPLVNRDERAAPVHDEPPDPRYRGGRDEPLGSA